MNNILLPLSSTVCTFTFSLGKRTSYNWHNCDTRPLYIGSNSEPKGVVPVVGKSTVEGFCLTLPGKQLDLSILLKEKKFRHKGNKEGALRAMRILEDDGLGRLEEKKLSNKSSVKVRTYI